MKVSGYITIILMVGLVFASIGSIVHDFETQYPDIEVNTSWEDEYNYADEINQSMGKLKEKFDIIGDEEEGWFSKMTAGITAIPRALIFVVSATFTTVSYGIIMLTQISTDMLIPGFIVVFATTAIFVIVIFKLVAHYSKSNQV